MEEEKAERFIRGVWPEISRYLVMQDVKTYHEVVQKSPLIEREELHVRPAASRSQMGGKGTRRQCPSRRVTRTCRFNGSVGDKVP